MEAGSHDGELIREQHNNSHERHKETLFCRSLEERKRRRGGPRTEQCHQHI